MKINTFFEYTLFVDESTFTNHGQINVHDIHYNCRKSSSITNKWIIKQNLMWKKVEKILLNLSLLKMFEVIIIFLKNSLLKLLIDVLNIYIMYYIYFYRKQIK